MDGTQTAGFALPPFLVLALPRSRTFWLSRFLSYGGWDCGQDQLVRMRGLDDVRSWLRTPMVGSVETAGAPWWRMALRLRPDIRLVTVRRHPLAVVDSLMRLPGVTFDEGLVLRTIRRLDAKLDQVEARVPGTLRVDYQDLEGEAACARVFQRCLCIPHQPSWWAAASGANLQINFPALVRYMQANGEQLARFVDLAKGEELGALRPLRLRGPIAVGHEPLEDFLRDGEALLQSHIRSVGEPGDAWKLRNLPLLRKLDAAGSLITTVGRDTRGRPQGYLLTILAPSVEHTRGLESLATAMHCLPGNPGLAMRLHRAALEVARAAGATKATFRAGVRGDGPRLGVIYQRLGARPMGQMWAIDFEGER